MKIHFPEVAAFSYAATIETNYKSAKLDTLSTFLVRWTEAVNEKDQAINQAKMSDWLEVRLEKDTVRVLGY